MRKFRQVVSALLFVATTVLAVQVAYAQQQQLDWCNGKGDTTSDLVISGCTAAIESGKYSGKNLAQAFNFRGRAYYGTNKYDRAIVDFDQAIKLDPNYASAFFSRAITRAAAAYKNKSSYELAIQDYGEALRLNPRNAAAYLNRGSIYLHTDHYDRAVQDYSQAVQLDPKNSGAFLGRGIAHYNNNDYPQAIADFKITITLDPKNAVSLYGQGLARKKNGDAGGDGDIAAAKTIQPNIAETFKSYGGK